jgi:hypothetical protein
MKSDDQINDVAGEAPPVDRQPWVKPEIVSFEPVSAAQGPGLAAGDGTSNLS